MKQVVFHQTGDADALQVIDAPPPTIRPGQVVVDVQAAGVNYIDIYQREGHIDLPRPFTPGFEGVGMIRAVGPDVTGLSAGQRIAWINVMGSYAQQLALPAEQAIPIPEGFSAGEAMLFQGVTAQYLLAEYRAVKPGDVVLVHAAAGGVGQILVQWLKHLGATVIATASSAEKLAVAKALGADHGINYSDGPFLPDVLALTGGRGVDLALDAVGETTFADSVRALAPRGTAILYGRASGLAPDVEMMPLILKGARVAGASLFVYIDDPVEMQARAADVIAALKAGWLCAPQTTAFALSDAPAAHRALQSRSSLGKLILCPNA